MANMKMLLRAPPGCYRQASNELRPAYGALWADSEHRPPPNGNRSPTTEGPRRTSLLAAAGRFLRPSGWLPRPRLSGAEPERIEGETQTAQSDSGDLFTDARRQETPVRSGPVRSPPVRRCIRRARCFSKPTHPSVTPSGFRKSVGPRGVRF